MMYEIYLCDDRFNRLTVLANMTSFSYTKNLNNLGAFSIDMPYRPQDTYNIDNIIQIYRDGIREFFGFLRKIEVSTDQSGRHTTTISGPDMNDLLKRRVIAFGKGTAQALKYTYADNIIKAFVRENLGSLAAAGRDITSLGFSVQADTSSGPTVSVELPWVNLLYACQQTANNAKATANQEVLFSIIPVSETTLEFQTGVGYFGQNTSDQVILGPDYGNLDTPVLTDDYSDEKNYIYLGSSFGSDPSRMALSLWNRREFYAYSTNQNNTTSTDGEVRAALATGLPKITFKANATAGYNTRWSFGDKVMVEYLGRRIYCLVRGLTIQVNDTGREDIKARLESYV